MTEEENKAEKIKEETIKSCKEHDGSFIPVSEVERLIDLTIQKTVEWKEKEFEKRMSVKNLDKKLFEYYGDMNEAFENYWDRRVKYRHPEEKKLKNFAKKMFRCGWETAKFQLIQYLRSK